MTSLSSRGKSNKLFAFCAKHSCLFYLQTKEPLDTVRDITTATTLLFWQDLKFELSGDCRDNNNFFETFP